MEATQPRRAFLVAVEGLDRSGKTTLVGSLVKVNHSKCEFSSIAFPDRSSTSGRRIDAMLTGRPDEATGKPVSLSVSECHQLFALNREEAIPKMQTMLNRGVNNASKTPILLTDRYAPSGAAYSVARGLDAQWCLDAEHADLPVPDMILFLDVRAEETATRQGFGDELFERIDIQQRVYQAYNKVSELYHPERWVRLASSGMNQQETLELAIRVIEEKFASM
jgi:dTMP kinase